MEPDRPLRCGFLLLPPPSATSLTSLVRLTKKKWQPKYCMLFKASKQGIERLEIYDSREDADACNCQKIVTLENCIKISQSPPGSGNVVIVSKTQTQVVSASTEAETVRWVRALQEVAFGDDGSRAAAINEDNDLYCSSGEAVFAVRLHASEASDRCGIEPVDYALLMTASALELRTVDGDTPVATWPYRYIRRYGYKRGKFTFEAGRKCQTGEGTFRLEHSNQQEIFRCLSLKMKSMKKLISTEPQPPPLPHPMDDSELRAALGMEARSRSPLPPSAASDEYESGPASADSSTSVPLRPLPIKPPRKSLFTKALDNYEPVATTPYDNVEVRSEAWRTLGIVDVDHVEFALNRKDDIIEPAPRSREDLTAIVAADSSKILILPSPELDSDDADYDRLQFFGSTGRLDVSSGYRAVVARPRVDEEPKPAWNDYDEVENVMQSVRLADDSYLGYGTVRKPSIPGPQVPIKTKRPEDSRNDVDRRVFDGTSYAIVSKAKRV